MRFEEYLQSANTDIAIILQAESRQAIDNIDAITAVDGLDAILVGPYDLSASLGKIGAVTDEEVVAAIDSIAVACKSGDIRLGIFGVSAAAVIPYIDNGFTLITAGIDSLFVISSANRLLADIHGQET